jgi:hypothetical protein
MAVPDFPLLASLLFLVVVAFLFVLALLGVRRCARVTDAPRVSRIVLLVGAGMLAWLGGIGGLAMTGFFTHFEQLPPPIVPPLVLMLGLTAWLAWNRRVGAWVDALPLYALIWPQAMRIVVEVVLYLLGEDGIAPPQMTWEGLNLDVIAGLTAPVIAWAAFGGGRQVRWLGIVWNVIGLGLLLNIVTVAILSTPTFAVLQPENTFIAYWPLVWLPTFVVPAALLMHVLSLRQLYRRRL